MSRTKLTGFSSAKAGATKKRIANAIGKRGMIGKRSAVEFVLSGYTPETRDGRESQRNDMPDPRSEGRSLRPLGRSARQREEGDRARLRCHRAVSAGARRARYGGSPTDARQ